jgi:hypothetical protein
MPADLRVPRAALGRIPGAPECALTEDVVRRLPEVAPPAPWDCRVRSLAWIQRAGTGASSALPAAVRGAGAPRWVIGAFVAYEDSPVGPYAEVWAGLLQREGARPVSHVPFMVVDSLASVLGGRVNWALPKALGAFSGVVGADGSLRVEGDGWWLRARARGRGPAVPTRIPVRTRQVLPDGEAATFRAVLRGWVRPAHVTVDMAPTLSLRSWLPPGGHLGVQLRDGAMRVDPLVRG